MVDFSVSFMPTELLSFSFFYTFMLAGGFIMGLISQFMVETLGSSYLF